MHVIVRTDDGPKNTLSTASGILMYYTQLSTPIMTSTFVELCSVNMHFKARLKEKIKI